MKTTIQESAVNQHTENEPTVRDVIRQYKENRIRTGRRNCTNNQTNEEITIIQIDSLGCDMRLTQIIMLLQQTCDLLGDYINTNMPLKTHRQIIEDDYLKYVSNPFQSTHLNL